MAQTDDGGVSKKVADAKKALEAAKTNPKVGTKSGHSYIGEGPKAVTPPAAPAKPKPASSGILGEAASAGEGLAAKQSNVDEYLKASGVSAPKMHKGGKVKEDGVKELQKGEVVLPKEKAKEGEAIMAMKGKAKGVMNAAKDEMDEEKDEKVDNKKEEKAEKKPAKKEADKKDDKKGAKHDFARTEIIHHRNGSHTTTHHPHPPKADKDGKMGAQAEPVSYGSPDFASMQQGMSDNLGGGPAQGAGPAAGGAPAEPAPAAL